MDSNNHNHLYDPNYISSSGSDLLRFRSAPSSVLAAFVHEEKSGFDSDQLLSRFVSSSCENDVMGLLNPSEFEDKSSVSLTNTSVSYTTTMPPPQPEPLSFLGLPPHYPRQSKRMMSSVGFDQFLGASNQHTNQVEPNLLRQISSPAGMFTNLSDQNGYNSMKDLMNYGGAEEDEDNQSNSNGLRRHCSLTPSPHSSLATESIAMNFQYSHWNNPTSFIDNLSSLKRETEDDVNLFHENKLLSHHLSLPKSSSSTSSDMVSLDKYLQLQDSVPCKTRAKRGCATHPRSIAERVRRTRISERMRKLQELVPNMDKQTNTADMLDLAVDYIKDLQRQYTFLNENRAKCKCMSKDQKLI